MKWQYYMKCLMQKILYTLTEYLKPQLYFFVICYIMYVVLLLFLNGFEHFIGEKFQCYRSIYLYIYKISGRIGDNYFRQLHRGWKNGGRSELSKPIRSIYSVLDYLWSDGNDFNFLVSYIKPDYKIFRSLEKSERQLFIR